MYKNLGDKNVRRSSVSADCRRFPWKPKASAAHKTEAAVKVTAQNLGINQEGLRPRAHAGEQEVTVKCYLSIAGATSLGFHFCNIFLVESAGKSK